MNDHQLVAIGKVTTVVGTLIAIISSPLFGHYTTIFEGLNKLICYIAPPITAVFLLGVFWKRASGGAALFTLLSGSAMGAVIFMLDLWRKGIAAALQGHNPNLAAVHALFGRWLLNDWMLTSFYMLLVCCGIMWVGSVLMPEPLKAEAKLLVWEDWREPLRGEAGGRGLGNYRILTALILAIFIVLYLIFR